VHVDDPGLPLSYGARLGLVSDVVVENMSRQAQAFWQQSGSASTGDNGGQGVADIGLVAVLAGQGLAAIFRSLGVEGLVADDEEILEVIAQLQSDQILLLPNGPSSTPVTERLQELTAKAVQVVPTETIPQGIAAVLAFNPQADLETNYRRMMAAARQVRTIEVRPARPGSAPEEFTGLLDRQPVSTDRSATQVVLASLAQAGPEDYELVTVYYGQMVTPEQAQALAAVVTDHYPQLDVELYAGAQQYYHYIISME
jgi:hypothetical protein